VDAPKTASLPLYRSYVPYPRRRWYSPKTVSEGALRGPPQSCTLPRASWERGRAGFERMVDMVDMVHGGYVFEPLGLVDICIVCNISFKKRKISTISTISRSHRANIHHISTMHPPYPPCATDHAHRVPRAAHEAPHGGPQMTTESGGPGHINVKKRGGGRVVTPMSSGWGSCRTGW
jgi:hypothetical protein